MTEGWRWRGRLKSRALLLKGCAAAACPALSCPGSFLDCWVGGSGRDGFFSQNFGSRCIGWISQDVMATQACFPCLSFVAFLSRARCFQYSFFGMIRSPVGKLPGAISSISVAGDLGFFGNSAMLCSQI